MKKKAQSPNHYTLMDEIIGLTLDEFVNLNTGRSYRVTKEDGESYMVTMDMRPDRLNFEINNGVIVDISFG